MKRTPKEILLRIVILFIGLTIAHFGVTLFLLSDLGADPLARRWWNLCWAL